MSSIGVSPMFAVRCHARNRKHMTIEYRIWRRICWVGGVISIPAVLFLFFQPNVGTLGNTLTIAANIFVFGLGGTGALLAVLTRIGFVQFHYTDKDRQSFSYRMEKRVAEMSLKNKRGFSSRYYENLDLIPPQRSSQPSNSKTPSR